MNIIATKGHLPFCMTYIYLQNKRHIFMDKQLSVILHSVARLISFLEVSYMGSVVSQMNFRVLKEEYDALHHSIKAYKNDKEVSSNLIVTREELEGVEQFHNDEKDKRT